MHMHAMQRLCGSSYVFSYVVYVYACASNSASQKRTLNFSANKHYYYYYYYYYRDPFHHVTHHLHVGICVTAEQRLNAFVVAFQARYEECRTAAICLHMHQAVGQPDKT